MKKYLALFCILPFLITGCNYIRGDKGDRGDKGYDGTNGLPGDGTIYLKEGTLSIHNTSVRFEEIADKTCTVNVYISTDGITYRELPIYQTWISINYTINFQIGIIDFFGIYCDCKYRIVALVK